jgi:transposase
MTLDPAQLPSDISALKALLIAERAARIASDARALEAEARAKDLDAEIEHLKLTIAKLQHDKFGSSSERARLLVQLELQLGELIERRAQEMAVEDMAASHPAAPAGAGSETPAAPRPSRQKPARRPLPAHLPRERVVYAPPSVCPCCTGTSFRKLGADETESLERVPAQ